MLVEKPIAGCARDAEAMVAAAREAGRVLMVNHTHLYGGPVRKIKELFESGDLGEIYYVDSVRINLGRFQHDVNVVWDLAPHDLAIMDHLIGRLPESLSAIGACHADRPDGLEDVAYLNLDYGDGLLASFHLNWLSPVKVRHFLVGGSRKGLVYDELAHEEKIKVYDRGITVSPLGETLRPVRIDYRTGDVWSPRIEDQEPLQAMIRHFAECIRDRITPLSDGLAGLRVVRMLEAAQRSIKAQGERIAL